MRIKIYCCLLLSFSASWLGGQSNETSSLSLTDAYHLLEERYPLLRNGVLLQQIEKNQWAQINAESKPVISLKADGRLQSETINLESDNPMTPLNISRPLVSAQTYLDASYVLLDGGFKEARQNLVAAQTKAELQQQEVDRFQLRERINQLFLVISGLRQQEVLFDLSKKDLEAHQEQVRAGVEYGVLLPTELTQLLVKEQELLAQQDNLNFQIAGAIQSLEQLLDLQLSPDVTLIYPELGAAQLPPAIQRPEQQLFQLKQEAILAQVQLTESERKPKLQVFAQAGVGYPNPLNLLDGNVAPYGIVGAGFSWKLIDWDKTRLQKETFQLQAVQLQNALATFEFNLDQGEAQYHAEMDRIHAQIIRDETIANLQAEILEQMAVQLDEGVITSADYVNQLNAELRARQNKAVHEVQLLQTQLNFWNSRGGF
ncbi:TolC family protein [Lewinella sp. LCG006]|uniref:TolC family protein n=1 Tax=Lewinella sp. LCG006 TaxID=3231911 RepID=UPI003460705A